MTARQRRRLQRKLARRPDLQNQQPDGLPTPDTAAHEAGEPATASYHETPSDSQSIAVSFSESSISEAKLAANRANAQLSTGPAPRTGKHNASQTSIRHGLTGTFRVPPDRVPGRV